MQKRESSGKNRVEVCALCQMAGSLMESHFFPKSAFKHVRGRGAVQDSPIHVDVRKGDAFYTDNQITKKLLCFSCEQLFSKLGENVVSKLWATNKDFPFHDLIKKSQLVSSEDGAEIFHSQSFSDELQRGIYYFALSMIWRAHIWSRDEYGKKRVDLGRYEEKIRNFLLGESDVDRVYLIVTVNTHRSINGLITTPVSRKMFGRHAYLFELLGMKYHLYVGGSKLDGFVETFLYMRSKVIIMTSRAAELAGHEMISDIVREKVVPRGRLARQGIKIC